MHRSVLARCGLALALIAAGPVLAGSSAGQGEIRVPAEATTAEKVAELGRRVESLAQELAYLRDRQQIHDVYRRYIWGFDRRDVERTKSAFWHDAQISYGTTTNSVDQFVRTHFAGHDAVSDKALQPVDEMSVDIDHDTAHVVAYLVEFNTLKNGRSRISGVRYIDRLDRRQGEWRIAVREVIFEFLTETDNNLLSNLSEMAKGRPYSTSPCGMGTRDKRDPAYSRPLKARADNTGAACAQ